MADFKYIIPFIKAAEGGMSRATTDTASKGASPCEFNGVKGWHTNKGITWETFNKAANYFKFDPTCAKFFEMPYSIWEKIYYYFFWQPFGLNDYKSQAIANCVVTWAWGSGVTGAYNSLIRFIKEYTGQDIKGVGQIRDVLNKLSEQDEKKLFDAMVNYRASFFKRLNQPANLKGWLSRLDQFTRLNQVLIDQKKNLLPERNTNNRRRNAIALTATGLTLITILYAIHRNNENTAPRYA